jgi:hypothetical protein
MVQRSLTFNGPVFGSSGNSAGAYFVMKNGNWEYGEQRCGLDIKHQSTKYPNRGRRRNEKEGQRRVSSQRYLIEHKTQHPRTPPYMPGVLGGSLWE